MGKIIYMRKVYSKEELREIVGDSLENSGLNSEEEKVLRMRQGWGKRGEESLELEIGSEVIKKILQEMEIQYLEEASYPKKK